MWRILDLRWRSRWKLVAGLAAVSWLAAWGMSLEFERWSPAAEWSGLACGVSLVAVWVFLRTVAVMDQREDRLVLHVTLPASLADVARARVADPLPAFAATTASCLVGLWALGVATTPIAPASFLVLLSAALLLLTFEQLTYLFEEVQSLYPDSTLPKILSVAVLSVAGAAIGFAGTRALRDPVIGAGLVTDVLGRVDTLLALLVTVVLLCIVNARLFAHRPDFHGTDCVW